MKSGAFLMLAKTNADAALSNDSRKSSGFTNDGHQPGGPWRVGTLLLRPIRVREQEPSVRGCQGDKRGVWYARSLLGCRSGSITGAPRRRGRRLRG